MLPTIAWPPSMFLILERFWANHKNYIMSNLKTVFTKIIMGAKFLHMAQFDPQRACSCCQELPSVGFGLPSCDPLKCDFGLETDRIGHISALLRARVSDFQIPEPLGMEYLLNVNINGIEH